MMNGAAIDFLIQSKRKNDGETHIRLKRCLKKETDGKTWLEMFHKLQSNKILFTAQLTVQKNVCRERKKKLKREQK